MPCSQLPHKTPSRLVFVGIMPAVIMQKKKKSIFMFYVLFRDNSDSIPERGHSVPLASGRADSKYSHPGKSRKIHAEDDEALNK